MRFSKRYRIDEITNTAPGRWGGTVHVRLDKERRVLQATNERAVVEIPVEVEDSDQSALIPVEAIKEARKGSSRGSGDAKIQVGASEIGVETTKAALRFETPIGDWPENVERFTPAKAPRSPESVEVCLDTELLAAVARALGGTKLVLQLPVNADHYVIDAIRVVLDDDSASYAQQPTGCVMPIVPNEYQKVLYARQAAERKARDAAREQRRSAIESVVREHATAGKRVPSDSFYSACRNRGIDCAPSEVTEIILWLADIGYLRRLRGKADVFVAAEKSVESEAR